MRAILCGLITLFVIPFYGSALATTDLTTLGSPNVTISPSSGPPGTMITITVSSIPDISNESYPYPDLYIYLPFSKPFGVTIPSHCDGEDCFPIYTHNDALKKNSGNRTITFSLFSTSNPKPVYLNGYENSVCDVVINGKIIERFQTLCNVKDEPIGTYQIRFVWAIETNLEQRYTAKTVEFTVTPSTISSTPQVAETGNSVIKDYQNGKITGAEFLSKLRTIGWNDEQIRQALAVIGKLPHQSGSFGPDNTQDILEQVNGSRPNINNTNSSSTESNTRLSDQVTSSTLPIVNSTQNESLSIPQQNESTFPTQQNNSVLNNVVIVSFIILAAAAAGAAIVFKKARKGASQGGI